MARRKRWAVQWAVRRVARRQRGGRGAKAWKSASSLFMFASALARATLSRRTCKGVCREAT